VVLKTTVNLASTRVARVENSTACKKLRYRGTAAAGVVIAVITAAVALESTSWAEPEPPPDSELIRPLPVINPTSTNWAPKFPFPYDQTKNRVTEADIVAMGEMCQWFNAEYETLSRQVDRVQNNRVRENGGDIDHSVDVTEQQVDIVVANIDQSQAFLTPRVQALTQSQDFAGDVYFPIYQGDAFYGIWQQLANVSAGMGSRQPVWFTGPSVQRAKKWGTDITRSHVCE
jgi:hypothetical protein